MESRAFTFHPGGTARRMANGVVYAPYSWGGNDNNSHNRYAALAQESGFDVINRHVPGTGAVIIDRATRRDLRRGDIAELAAQEAANVEKYLNDYEVRVAMGDSGRGLWVATMSLHKIFSHVLIRDGFNAHAPESVLQGTLRVLLRAGSWGEAGPQLVPNDPQTLTERAYSAACSLSEMKHHARLMCGTASTQAMVEMVAQPELPVHNVSLGHGIGGRPEQMRRWNETFVAIRAGMPGSAPFLGTDESRWGHANLLEPTGAAQHIRQTVELGLPTER